ncbi:unnamed protein product [Heligmosomoides polygyrus]|uniref:THAP-type domain-containing protein n=1 Tax=Heligmosomoides polygyrus TaxID=6339 RepID=A0A183F8H9_HELPZ|nr:unnamed protein product [Heligmosomoides polygyrus]
MTMKHNTMTNCRSRPAMCCVLSAKTTRKRTGGHASELVSKAKKAWFREHMLHCIRLCDSESTSPSPCRCSIHFHPISIISSIMPSMRRATEELLAHCSLPLLTTTATSTPSILY